MFEFTDAQWAAALTIIIAVIGAFLIGWFFAWLYYRGKIARWREQAEDLEFEVNELKEQNKALNDGYLKLSKENKALRERNDGSANEKQLDELREELNQLRFRNNELINENLDLKSRGKQLEEAAEDAADKVADESESLGSRFSKELEAKRGYLLSKIGFAKREQKDDLTKINGVGPQIAEKLNSIGIYSYDQISKLTPKDITIIDDLIQYFPGRIERDDWIGQAQKLLRERG